ncbi:MAG TPA: two-component regulator propeller domain-containing protein [Prolixibacteraceae bacterium]|nr:two-component regulator propeller domain-containing protein [Prolixibacteraceae bacterium]
MKRWADEFKWFFWVVFLLGVNSSLWAQKIESPLISKLSTEEGLSSNTVYSILQDDKGFIWIATELGLNKFDGKDLTCFATGKGRYSLSHNRTQTMLMAPDGNIWAGTSDGLNIYDYASDSIIQVRTTTKPLFLVYNDITVLSPSIDQSKIWIGTYGAGVNYFDWKTKEFHSFPLPKLNDVSDPLNIMSLLEDDNNRLWIGTQTNGLYRYDLKEKKFEYYHLPENGRFVRVIYQDNFRRIWIGTSKGCYIYNETNNRLDLVTYPERLISSSIGTIREDRNGKLWIGTEMFLMDFSVRAFSLTESFSYQMFESGESTSRLSCPSVNTVYADLENNVWIGTAWGGVNMLKGSPAKFLLFKHDADRQNSLPSSPVTNISNDGNNTLYVVTMGTGKVGLCSMNIVTGEVAELPIDRKLPGYVYESVLVDSDRDLWIGTYNQGLIRTSLNRSDFKQFLSDPSNPASLPDNDVRAIYEGTDKTIWIGTNNGLARYDKRTSQMSTVKISENRHISIRSIKEDKSGTLWLGTYGNAVITYNPRTGVVNNTPMDSVMPHIVSNIIFNNDVVWIAANGEGVLKFDTKTKKHRYFNEKDGLASNYTVSVQCDRQGNVWVGHGKGISKINTTTNEIVNFNSGDGVQPREFSENAALTLPNGLMVFAGFGGITVFDPMNVVKDDKCPRVIFTKLLVSNEVVAPSENKRKHSPIKENISLAQRIDLRYDQSVFTIEFMGVNYNANQKIQYAYLLEGSDKDWNQLGNQNSVTFRNLKSGEYTFKVKASSPDAVWTDSNIISLTIVIHPPFWASVWAYLIYSVLLLVLFYFIGLFIIVRIEAANNLKIERAQREKEEELHQEKLQFFTNISHELRTPLTLIIGPLETMQLEESDEEKKSNIKLMLHNAKRLLSMVNQLLDFRKAERGQMKLKVQYADIIASFREIVISFEELKRQKAIELAILCPEEKIMAWYDVEFINKSLINLLSNAFKFTPRGGKITIVPEVVNDAVGNRMLSVSVIDNGNGISEKDLPFVFDRFYQGEEKSSLQQGTGIGLHLVKNLIELHHGTIEVESVRNVQTIFKMTIPIEKTAYLKDEFLDQQEMPFNPIPDVSSLVNVPVEEKIQEATNRETRKRILVVEDNADIRNYIKSILGQDYTIEEAENGLIGWDLVGLNEFDLVISDIMMPEMDGIEMCRRMKASVETDHIPIILLTAKSDIENRIEGLSLGADSYITKPFHPKHLTVRVAKLIELRELLKERYSRKILLGEFHDPDKKTDSTEELFLKKTISIISEKMIESEFNGDILASELNISRMGLHRKIKALTGQTTGEFIRNIRLKKACELLSVDGMNISEVCYSVGFNSPSYFTTCFTELYKMTPTEYVRNLKLKGPK